MTDPTPRLAPVVHVRATLTQNSTAAVGQFTTLDLGGEITGEGIPADTRIVVITSQERDMAVVALSQPCTRTGVDVPVRIARA